MSKENPPKRRGKTHLAYITDEEEGLLLKRDAEMGSKTRKFSPEGIPILNGEDLQTPPPSPLKGDHTTKKSDARRASEYRAAANPTTNNYAAYVDNSPDLAAAYEQTKSGTGEHGEYWAKRISGPVTKESFAIAHYGESKQLQSGTYGSGTRVEGLDVGGTYKARNMPGFDPATPTTPITPTTPSTPGTPGPADDGGGGGGDPAPTPTAGAQPGTPIAPDINPTAIGALSPSELVSYRLTQLMSQKTPYTQAALRDALAASLRRGLQSSSLSLSAGLAGTLESLFPIASQDAGSSLSVLQQNLTAQNNSILTEYTTKSNFKLTTYGYEMDAWNKAKQRDHESSEQFKQRTWQAKQNNLDRTLQAQLAELNVEASSSTEVNSCRSRAMEIYVNTVNSYQSQLRKGQVSSDAYNKMVGDAAKLRDQMMRMCSGD
jgi:hypothetical protein